jgi:hypothetical protein
MACPPTNEAALLKTGEEPLGHGRTAVLQVLSDLARSRRHAAAPFQFSLDE